MQLPLGRIVERTALDAIDAGPGRDPEIATLRLQHVVDESVAQTFGNVVRLPLLAGGIEYRHAPAIGADHDAALQLAHVEDAVRQQSAAHVVQLVFIRLRRVADQAAGSADPDALAIDVETLDVLVADAEMRKALVRRQRGPGRSRDRPLAARRGRRRRMAGRRRPLCDRYRRMAGGRRRTCRRWHGHARCGGGCRRHTRGRGGLSRSEQVGAGQQSSQRDAAQSREFEVDRHVDSFRSATSRRRARYAPRRPWSRPTDCRQAPPRARRR